MKHISYAKSLKDFFKNKIFCLTSPIMLLFKEDKWSDFQMHPKLLFPTGFYCNSPTAADTISIAFLYLKKSSSQFLISSLKAYRLLGHEPVKAFHLPFF